MRWSETGLEHLLALRVAWVNQRFDELFANDDLSLPIISPNPEIRPITRHFIEFSFLIAVARICARRTTRGKWMRLK